MGSPMVFHTAPPHPLSKARMICSPQLVGGPEASQKGLGERMPAKLVVRSAIGSSFELACHGQGRAFAVSHGVYDFSSAVDAIAAGIITRVGSAAGGTIDRDGAAVQLDAAGFVEDGDEARLPERGNHHVKGDFEIGAGDGCGAAAAGGIGFLKARLSELDRRGAAI